MAIYGQSWRGGGNMSFRNPMMKAAMNNNPQGNQQTLKPVNSSPQPQYINPTLQAGQANLQRLNQSMAQTLNRPLQRRADSIAGVQPGPMINPNAARNVLMGQNPDANLSMRPMTIPGMKFDPQQNAMVRSSPYEARGIQPGSLRQDPIMAFEKFNNPDDFRVATGGTPMIPFGSKGGQVSGGNPMSQAGISSVANARIARAARINGVTSSGIDQWRKTSPIAQTIRGNADTRIANLPQRPVPQVQPVLAQEQNPAGAPTPQVQPSQVAGMGDWDSVVNPPAMSIPGVNANPEVQAAVPPENTDRLGMVNQDLVQKWAATANPEEKSAIKNQILANEAKQRETGIARRQAAWRAIQNIPSTPQGIAIRAYQGARNMLGGR